MSIPRIMGLFAIAFVMLAFAFSLMGNPTLALVVGNLSCLWAIGASIIRRLDLLIDRQPVPQPYEEKA